MTEDEIIEALSYINGVFPPAAVYDRLVEEGAYGDETHTIQGDDLAGACWHLHQLMEHFGIPEDVMDRARWQNARWAERRNDA
jgi:hypothetical protein